MENSHTNSLHYEKNNHPKPPVHYFQTHHGTILFAISIWQHTLDVQRRKNV